MAIEEEMTPQSVIVSEIGPIPSPSSASLPHRGHRPAEGKLKESTNQLFPHFL